MPRARIDDATSVEYLVAGDPQADVADVVLVHGTGQTAAATWSHLIDGLRDGRRALAPDLAGSGGTIDAGGPLELPALVEQVAGAAAHAGSEQYDLVGFSLGAVVAAQLAATYPERVRRLVLIAGWASSEDGRVQVQFDLWRRLWETDIDALAQLTTISGFSSAFLARRPTAVVRRMVDDARASFPPGLGRQTELDQRIDITGSLGAIRAATLVVGCKQDQMVPVQHTRGLVAPISWSDYTEIDSGHLVVFEQPATLIEMVTGFLSRPDRRRVGAPYDGPERRR